MKDDGKKYPFIMQRDSIFNDQKNKKEDSVTEQIPSVWLPNKSYGLNKKLEAKSILFKNATLWTNEDLGIVKSADIAISNGKIVAIGENLDTNQITNTTNTSFEIINVKGKHITSGIIDEHSHIAISKGVNERSQEVTAVMLSIRMMLLCIEH